jgi:hypothetical protein
MKRGAGRGQGQGWQGQGRQEGFRPGHIGQERFDGSSRQYSLSGHRSKASEIPNKKLKPSFETNRGGVGGSGGVGLVKALRCLYSHQKLKKKKTWLDGEIKIFLNQRKCVLYKVDETNSTTKEILDSKYCPDLELDRIMNGIADSIEFEKYLVEVDHTSHPASQQEGNPLTQVASLNKVQELTSKLKKVPFKVPQTVAPPPPPPDLSSPDLSSPMGRGSGVTDLNSRKRGFYSIDENELDDIWDSTHCESAGPTPHIESLPKSSLEDLDFNISSNVQPSLSHQTELYTNQMRDEPEGEDLEDEYIDLRNVVSTERGIESFGGQYLFRDDSNPWPRYGEELEGEEVEEEEKKEGEEDWLDKIKDQKTFPSSSSTPSCPVVASENKMENNIWSRMFDSSQCQIGFVDESSN